LGSAQLSGNLSPGCESALTKLLGDKDINACFPFGAVTSLATSGQVPDQTTLKNAADAICADPKCSDALISQTQSTVKAACQADITANVTIAQLVDVAVTLYSPTRDSICFKNSTGGYCFIESYATTEQILQSAPANQNPALTFAGAPKEAICTPCNKAILNTYINFQNANPNAFADIPQITNQDITDGKNALTGKCGQDFLNGQIGDSTESPANFQTSSQKSDAKSLIANRMSFVVLVGSLLATL